MTATNEFCVINPTRMPKPASRGDVNPAASDILDAMLVVVEVSAMLNEIANRYYRNTPANAAYFREISAALAGFVLDAIMRCPP